MIIKLENSTVGNLSTKKNRTYNPVLSLIRGVHIGARALLNINFDMVWLYQ
jgi:hypothetical protein